MKLKELSKHYEAKEKHYEISDEFVKEGWGQAETSGNTGYIAKAKARLKKDKTIKINPRLAEPNQKWHLLVSYMEETSPELPAKTAYSKIICPELLLWMAEAANVEEKKIKEAKQAAIKLMKEKRNAGATWRCRNDAGRKIKEIIPWELIEKGIEDEKRNND